MAKDMNESVREYLAKIGRTGGRISKRALTKREARNMAMLRWTKRKGENDMLPTSIQDQKQGAVKTGSNGLVRGEKGTRPNAQSKISHRKSRKRTGKKK